MNAAYFVPLLGITLMAIGVIGVGTAAWHSHRQNQRLDFIRSLGSEAELYAEATPTLDRVQTPLVNRIFRPVGKGLRAQPVAALPLPGHRPRPRRSAQGRAYRFNAGGGIRRHPGGIDHAGDRHRSRDAYQWDRQSQVGVRHLVHSPDARRPRTELVAPSSHQGTACAGHQRPPGSARPHDDLRCRGSRAGASHAGLVARASSRRCATSCGSRSGRWNSDFLVRTRSRT